jgi:5-methylcytosine-specific restriction endonuclease McrA
MSLRWPPRSEALKRSRKDRGLYQCAMCHELFKSHKVHLDHIHPVIALDQKEFNWTNFIERLFCDVEGFQVLCTSCHDAKTAIEDQMRMFFKHEKGKK